MKFNAFWVEKTESGFERSIIERDVDELPEGDVVIDVAYSSLNYKDGLSASGSPGVTRNYPPYPGYRCRRDCCREFQCKVFPGR